MNNRWGEAGSRIGSWLLGLAAVLATLLFLAFLQRIDSPVEEFEEVEAMNFIGAQELKSESKQGKQRAEPKLTLPKQEFLDTPNLELDPVALSLTVKPDQLVTRRFEFEALGMLKNLYGLGGFATVADVDEEPRPLKPLAALFPEELILRGIYSGEVSIVEEVDEQGFGRVRRVLTASHPELVPIVVEVYNRALYTAPTKNGKPTKMVMRVNVRFSADAARIQGILKKPKEEKK